MIRNTLFLFLLLTLCVSFLSFNNNNPVPEKKQKLISTIIVDAGHGIMSNGGHNGAKGSYSYEDDICLAVSKELVKNFHREMPEIKIVESRPTEKTVSYTHLDVYKRQPPVFPSPNPEYKAPSNSDIR